MQDMKQKSAGSASPAEKKIVLPAELPRVAEAIGFVEDTLTEGGCPQPVVFKMNIVTDEIFSNICKFAYPDGSGNAVIRASVDVAAKKARLIFSDSGVDFDPLGRERPDTALPAEERPVGGLGILMVRKMMDEVSYERRGGENILTLVKNF